MSHALTPNGSRARTSIGPTECAPPPLRVDLKVSDSDRPAPRWISTGAAGSTTTCRVRASATSRSIARVPSLHTVAVAVAPVPSINRV